MRGLVHIPCLIQAALKIELSKQESVHAVMNKQAMAVQKVHQQMLLEQFFLKYLLSKTRACSEGT